MTDTMTIHDMVFRRAGGIWTTVVKKGDSTCTITLTECDGEWEASVDGWSYDLPYIGHGDTAKKSVEALALDADAELAAVVHWLREMLGWEG